MWLAVGGFVFGCCWCHVLKCFVVVFVIRAWVAYIVGVKIYLARHAQTNYNVLDLANSDPSVDVHLTSKGIL